MEDFLNFWAYKIGGFIAYTTVILGGGGDLFDFEETVQRNLCCREKLYQLQTMQPWDSSDLASKMRLENPGDSTPLGQDGERIPTSLYDGLWWMDGNSAPEELVTFADAWYEDQEFDGEFRIPTLAIDGGTWSYQNDFYGRSLFMLQCVMGIAPYFLVDPETFVILYQSENEQDGTRLTRLDEDTYTKRILFGFASYTLRRIIRGDGTQTNNWSLYETYARERGTTLVTYRRYPWDILACQLDDFEVGI